jgi:hypothetical protein
MKTCENCKYREGSRCRKEGISTTLSSWCAGWKKAPIDNSHLHPVFREIVDGLTRLPNPAVSGVDE